MAKWLNKYDVLDSAHVKELEQDAAIREFHQRHPREQAESGAYEDYKRKQHATAAGHHLTGMKAALGAGDPDEAKMHGDMYALHLKAMGHDPLGRVPPEVHAKTTDKGPEKVYVFKNHPADQLVAGSLGKAEGKSEAKPCFACGKAAGARKAADTATGKTPINVCRACGHHVIEEPRKGPLSKSRSAAEAFAHLAKATKLAVVLRAVNDGRISVDDLDPLSKAQPKKTSTTTPHSCGGPVFGKLNPDCKRCDELRAGAPAVKWAGADKKSRERSRVEIEDIRSHNCKRDGCGPVCTRFEW